MLCGRNTYQSFLLFCKWQVSVQNAAKNLKLSTSTGCTEPLGLTNGQIPDFAITASSMWNLNHAPKYGRLYTLNRDGHSGAWKSGRHVLGEWLQVDLGASVTITKIATQGRNWRNRYLREWVKSYTLAYSRDGESFEYYKEVL